MILDAEQASTRPQGLACPHCRAFNLRRLEARVPFHVYPEQGVVVDTGLVAPDAEAATGLRFSPYRCVDPVCACLWLRVERDGSFFGWTLGS